VARDRKRAKQRRGRRGVTRGAPADDHAGASPAGHIDRSNVPGALDHASAEVDEFESALVSRAGGVPVAPDADAEQDSAAAERDDAEAERDDAEAERDDAAASLPAAGPAPARTSDDGGRGDTQTARARAGERAQPEPVAPRGGARAVAFLRASWAELQRVQWPDRRQTFQATAVVLGFVVVAGAYLGVADLVAKEIVEFIL
jgi:preprotein translocase subunit SecE